MTSTNVLVICGPTSCGKTILALRLAKEIGADILAADSRQVYKFMDIGTGKLPVNSSISVEKGESYWLLDGVKVWGYDLVAPDVTYSAYDFALFGLAKLKEVLTSKPVIIVGGTGFYIDILTQRLIPASSEPDWDLRAELNTLSLDDLREKLNKLNPGILAKLDANNPKRLIRAIEREVGHEKKGTPLPYLNTVKYIQVGLKAANATMFSRADAWLDTIWTSGLLGEVQQLRDAGYKDSPRLKGLVYKEVSEFLDGVLPEDAAKQRAKYALHAYIRRQLTWFKRNEAIKWFDCTSNGIIDEIRYNLTNG
jgi:tRNA dimethylallyltransferase